MATTREKKAKADVLVELLEGPLAAELARMPVETLWDTCTKAGVPYQQNGEPRRRADLIEELLTKEMEKARAEMTERRASERAKPVLRIAPEDLELHDGAISLTLEEMAIALAPFLPINAQVHTSMQRAEVYTRASQRVAPDAVVFSRPDRQGNDRQYRLTFPTTFEVEVDKGD